MKKKRLLFFIIEILMSVFILTGCNEPSDLYNHGDATFGDIIKDNIDIPFDTSRQPYDSQARGNSTGNIINHGHVATDGEWIYYRNTNDGGRLYKTRIDGTENTQVSTDINSGFINVIDGWIYYYSGCISKIRTDGTEKTQLNEDSSWYINVVDDWIYYADNYGTNDGYIYKIRTDGTEKTQLNEDSSWYINVVDDWIYYINSNDGYNYIYKIRTDGTERTQINNDRSSYINVVGDYIYYLNGDDRGYIYKIRKDGTERKQLSTIFISGSINVTGDWVYFTSLEYDNNGYPSSRKLCKMRTNGTEIIQLTDDNSEYINVVEDWIYYVNDDERDVDDWNGGVLYKIRTDGTERQKVE